MRAIVIFILLASSVSCGVPCDDDFCDDDDSSRMEAQDCRIAYCGRTWAATCDLYPDGSIRVVPKEVIECAL